MVNSSVKFYEFFDTFFKKVGNYNFSSPLLHKRLLLFCFFSSEMCLGMDHVMEVSSYCVLRKSHCARGWSDVCFHWVVFLFSGVLCCLVLWGFFSPLGFFLGIWDRKGGDNSLIQTRYVLQAHLNRKASRWWCLSDHCHIMCLIWRVCANALLLFGICLFSYFARNKCSNHVNLQFWSQKVVILACHCCIKTIPILIKAMFDISDIILRTMGYDLGVVILTVSSVQ